jgi:hypothetical protein
LETINDVEERIVDANLQQVTETARSRAINCFLRQPKVTKYMIGWVTKHGAAVGFSVENPKAGADKTDGRPPKS